MNVPVGPHDVLNTIQNLPRTPTEAGIITILPVNLKRKLEYKNTHLAQLINTKKIYKYLNYLCTMGHPSYKFYDDYNKYEQRCLREDPIGSTLVFPEAQEDIDDLKLYLCKLKEKEMNSRSLDETGKDIDLENNDIEENDEEKEEQEYVKKDPIRKYQYDYNKTTCMTNKFPEGDSESSLSFAPAEGKIPSSILKDEDWDINSFPNLHPSGRNKMFQERKKKMTPQQYLVQRFRNKDTRFEQCTPYVFASAAFLEEKQMERNIGVSFSKGKLTMSDGGSKTYKLEDAYVRVFKLYVRKNLHEGFR